MHPSDLRLDGLPSFNDARSKRERFAALREEARYHKEAGELVEAAEVIKRWAALVAVTRAKILPIASRIRDLIPGLTAEQRSVVDAIVRESIEDMVSSQ